MKHSRLQEQKIPRRLFCGGFQRRDRESVKADETGSKMGMVETMEVFSLTYDHNASRFILSLCYADGKTHTSIYDKLEYCS